LGSAILGRILMYYFYELVKTGMSYFSGKSIHKKEIGKILDSISNNKKVVSDISKFIDPKSGIDSGTADKILNLPYIRTQIIKMSDSTNGELTETEIENQLKTILIKSWNDASISDKVVQKVKKDLK
jgi:hypothetical protein